MLSQLLSNLSQSLGTSIIALMCVFAVGLLQVPQLNQLRNKSKNALPQALQTEVESEKLRLNLSKKLPAFGFDNLLGDWVFVGFLQYFGDEEARQYTGYGLSPQYFDIIVDRDPRFLNAYIGLSTSISLYALMPQLSVALMDKGLKSMSPKIPLKSYYVWRYKGTDELLFLGNAQAARQSFKKAAEWASVYSDPESKDVAAISWQTAEFLARNPNNISPAQESAWAGILTTAASRGDQRTVKLGIHNIEALGGKVIITPKGTVKVKLPK